MRRTMTTILVFTMLVALPGIALAAAGDLDPSFGTGGSTTPIPAHPRDVALQSDGKIVGLADGTLTRWTSDGDLDASFGSGGSVPVYQKAYQNAYRLAVQPREGAEFVLVDDVHWELDVSCWCFIGGTVGINRYTPSGALDQTFSANMAFTNGDLPYLLDLEVQPDGGIIQAITVGHGPFDEYTCIFNSICHRDPRESHMLVRYRPDGGLDESFGVGGIVTLGPDAHDVSYGAVPALNSARNSVDVAIQPDGRLVMATAVKGGIVVRRLQADGTLDPSFAPTTTITLLGFPEDPSIAIDGDGNIIVAAGACATYSRTDCETQVRKLQSDGIPDSSFTEARITGAPLTELEIDATGALLVIDPQRMTRLRASGQVDETFGYNGSVAVANLRAAEVQPDLKIVAIHYLGDWWESEMVVSRYLGSAEAIEPPPPATTGEIAGLVTTTSGAPIAGAVIDCGTGGSSTSSTSGEYWITDVPEGSYQCTASASGYRSQKQHVTVVSGETTTANFQLRPGGNR